jgi:large subunit ribosomal protein L22
VADLVRGRGVEESIQVLEQTHTKGARILSKVLNSAVANAMSQEGSMKVHPDQLYIKEAFVDGGPIIKRFMPRAMGRATRINKRTSHLTIVLDVTEQVEES